MSRTADIDFSFWDLFDSGSSGAELDSLAALMGYVEARKGPWGIYGDVVWGKFDFSGGAVTGRNPIENLKLSASAQCRPWPKAVSPMRSQGGTERVHRPPRFGFDGGPAVGDLGSAINGEQLLAAQFLATCDGGDCF
jgi:hypothetical protein